MRPCNPGRSKAWGLRMDDPHSTSVTRPGQRGSGSARAGPAARSIELAYALHAAIMLTGSFDRTVGELGSISADLVRELHALDRRLACEGPWQPLGPESGPAVETSDGAPAGRDRPG